MRLLRTLVLYGLLSIPVIAIILFIFWKPIVIFVLHELPFMGQTFSKAKWEDAVKCSSREECIEKEISCIRGPMYLSLKRNHLQMGTRKETVIDLLGTAKAIQSDPSCTDYELGMCSGFRIDYDWLRICYDRDNKVTAVSHYQG